MSEKKEQEKEVRRRQTGRKQLSEEAQRSKKIIGFSYSVTRQFWMGLALRLGTQGMKPEQVSTANKLGRLQTLQLSYSVIRVLSGSKARDHYWKSNSIADMHHQV